VRAKYAGQQGTQARETLAAKEKAEEKKNAEKKTIKCPKCSECPICSPPTEETEEYKDSDSGKEGPTTTQSSPSQSSPDKSSINKFSADKTLSGRVLTEKSSTDKYSVEKASSNKASADKSSADNSSPVKLTTFSYKCPITECECDKCHVCPEWFPGANPGLNTDVQTSTSSKDNSTSRKS
jgi:hypothetical protein